MQKGTVFGCSIGGCAAAVWTAAAASRQPAGLLSSPTARLFLTSFLKSQEKANLDSSFVLVYLMIRLRRNTLRNRWEKWRTTSESCFNRTRGLHARFSRWLSNESCLRCICIWSGVILQFDLSANSAFPLPYCELWVVFCCNGPFHVWTKEFAVASCNSFSLLTDAEANCSCRGLTCFLLIMCFGVEIRNFIF